MKGKKAVWDLLKEGRVGPLKGWLGESATRGRGRADSPGQLQLRSREDWRRLIELSGTGPVVIFKHSTACVTSAHALGQFEEFVSVEKDLKFAILMVIQDRTVSNLVAEQLNIRHESPQIIVIRQGCLVWHASHWMIDHGRLKQAIA